MYSCPFCFRRAYELPGRLQRHISQHHAHLMDRLTADRAQLSSQCPGDDDTPMFEDQESNDAHRGESSRSPTPPTRVDYHPTPGRATEIDRMATAEGTDPVKSDAYLRDPWYPFNDETEYKLARWFVETEVPKRKINEFFNMGLSPLEGDASTHFASADGLWKKVAKMSHSDLLMFKEKTVDFGIPNAKASPMFYRDPVKLLKYILKQPAYARDMVWNPVREFDSLGRRVYSELHTADWWWEEQTNVHPEGGTIVPVIFASDETHLTNFSGDKKAWPIYMTLGNLPSATRNAPTSEAMYLVALLPIPPKKKKLKQRQKDRIEKILQECLYDVLLPLAEAAGGPVEIDCCDSKRRSCHIRICGWIADHMEYVKLLGLKPQSCPKCEVGFRDLQTVGQDWPARDYRAYMEKRLDADDGNLRSVEELGKLGVSPFHPALSSLPNIRVDGLHKPDLLHGIHLGLTLDILEWTVAFLKKYKRADAFDRAWLSLSPHVNFERFTKAYSQITQWKGKELRHAGKILISTVAAALTAPSPAERAPFRKMQQCLLAYVNFHLMAQYKFHNETTLGYMTDYWEEFAALREEPFHQFRPTAKAKKNSESYTRKAKKDLEDTMKTFDGTAREKRTEEASKLARIETEAKAIYDSLSSFNYVKMHLPNHFASSIRAFGCLGGFSTDAGELAHVKQLKDGWRASNHVNAYRQIIDFYNRKHQFRIRELNLLQVEREQVDETLTERLRNVFDSFYTAEERRELHRMNRTGIARQLLEDPEDSPAMTARLRPLLGNRTFKSVVHKGKSPTVAAVSLEYGIPDLGLAIKKFFDTAFREASRADRVAAAVVPATLEDINNYYCLRCYNQLAVPVDDFQEPLKFVMHPVRCTGPRPWRNGSPRHDNILFQKGTEGSYGAFSGRAVAKVEALFEIRDHILGIDHSLAMITEYPVKANGAVNPSTNLVTLLNKALAFSSSQSTPERYVISVESILGMAHVVDVPGVAESLLNTHVDLTTYNDIY